MKRQPDPLPTVNDESLIVVGTGIRATGQLSTEAIAWMRCMDKVLYVTSDPIAEQVIKTLNPEGAESLMGCYGENKLRNETYREIVTRVMDHLHEGKRVCYAAYGHPGVFAVSTHEVIRRARAEGFKARMLPAISAEDCLFADLGVDPVNGCNAYEATDFLLNLRTVDPSSHLILWQVGGLGDATYKAYHYEIRGLMQLANKLMGLYGPHHLVTLYEAALFPGVEPLVRSGPLHVLPHGAPTPNATLYVPPIARPHADPAVRRDLGALA